MAQEQGNTFWLVDGRTRVVLPSSSWGQSVREVLTERGHIVQRTSQDPNALFRDDDELARKDVLLDESGM